MTGVEAITAPLLVEDEQHLQSALQIEADPTADAIADAAIGKTPHRVVRHAIAVILLPARRTTPIATTIRGFV